MEENYHPLISVIITSYELASFHSILALLNALENQTYDNIEVVIVVERSRVLHSRLQEYLTMKHPLRVRCYFAEDQLGASMARNLGIMYARGQVIAFVDDDTIPESTWAQEIVKTFTLNKSYIGVIGPVIPVGEDEDISWLPVELQWLVSGTGWFDKKGVIPISGHTWTSNACFKREAFANGISFSEKLGPRGGVPGWKRANISEDVELSMRIQKATGGLIVYNSAIMSWKMVRRDALTWRRIISCSLGIGISRVSKQRLFQSNSQSDLLGIEKKLARRIVFNLIPRTLANPKHLKSIARILVIIFVVTLFLSVGYAFAWVTNISI